MLIRADWQRFGASMQRLEAQLRCLLVGLKQFGPLCVGTVVEQSRRELASDVKCLPSGLSLVRMD